MNLFSNSLTWISRLHSIYKLLLSIAAAVLIVVFLPGAEPVHLKILLGWDIFCVVLLSLTLVTFTKINSSGIREQSKKQDETRVVIFILVLVATLASMGETFSLLTNKAGAGQTIIGIAGMIFSWLLVHTIFTLRYAHLYYGNDKHNVQKNAGGLEFPGDEHPDYFDFAYFSFVLGMTFQVSDVQITSKRLRRLSLIHGLISFMFNTFIVALTINIIAGLMGK